MPLDTSIKKTLVIGSGPIVIGQAAEFDYAGTQACRVLKDAGIEIVLANSNPATIMTDNAMADKIYIEPLTLNTIKRIIIKERPDSILSGLGGQTGLNLCMQLAREGFLNKHNIRLLGSNPETIDKSEDRQMFKNTMASIGQPTIPSIVTEHVDDALDFAEEIGYPIIVRPAFTLGGSGGGIAKTEAELKHIASNGIAMSPINQILVEQSIAGWKEIEFEIMRDKAGNAIAVCSMENFDPVGIHTGDSIVIAPAVTLADKEYQMLRSAALDIIQALKVEGGCNCQFALNPNSFDYAVIEVNPRVSRSSALASKATGYPIAKVATKIAIGYNLDEIKNDVTGNTYAAFEPTLDYVAVKFPKWPFDKFVYAKKELGTQMKATGEVMSIADSFELAIVKAVRGAEISAKSLDLPKIAQKTDEELLNNIQNPTDERLFEVYQLLKRGVSVDKIHELTLIDKWFLHKINNIVTGAYDSTPKPFMYKMVDTCSAEFAAQTPYFYSIHNAEENEALEFIDKNKKPTVVVLGSGPIRIGQGIEFDYACVHCVWTLKQMGYETVVINNNPETVSTDFDTADRLYFEPLTIDDVMGVIEIEKPIGVIVSFGGGTAIKLTNELQKRGVKILGTSADSIDICEDRERFDAFLEKLNIARPKGYTVFTLQEALDSAHNLGYPVLMRPSYVLGGQNMIIAYSDDDIKEYMEIIFRQKQENPVLIDKYLSGLEIEVDSICDGEKVLIPGIMEHVERTGVHSGDSIAVYPAPHINDELAERIYDMTKRISLELKVQGLINIQYIISHNDIYVIEVNPRASRTVPYISKVTGVPMCDLATRTSLGEKLQQEGIAKVPPYTAVKIPVFSFEKLVNVDTHLGPEMKSTGEVLGIGKNLQEALYKGLVAAGYKLRRSGGVFITVRDSDKLETVDIARKFARMGFRLFATEGTKKVLEASGLKITLINKIHENPELNSDNLLDTGKVNYIISTSTKGRDPTLDDVKLRRKSVFLGIPCLTSIDTAGAIADSLLTKYTEKTTELVDINNMRSNMMKIKFTKMHGCGNDYIYINCFDQQIESPESLAVNFSDRRKGVGSDGIILIMPSDTADAKMRIFNQDGSEGKMCGNGIRCVGKYLYDNKIIKKDVIKVDTLSGIKTLELSTTNGKVTTVKVDMGSAILNPADIPVDLSGDSVVDRQVQIDDADYNITCVSMGNPHCVVFCNNVDALDLATLGPKFENNEIFPEQVNTEFVQVVDSKTIKMRVWERGSGETFACGTGACAAAVASVLNGHCNKGEDITVKLIGGNLKINYTDETVFMTGDANVVYNGELEI
ncbi:MAG: carbamoyl-phosphate synthase large subunit [Clostridiales bacterium]|jgi:carbamoyl-phosphate synthase large subunit|nr:carbamoyl-phosphate synthase large subunit [Clostridiales bacterium]